MAESFKYKNDTYLDSTSVAHKQQKLSEILENKQDKLNIKDDLIIKTGRTINGKEEYVLKLNLGTMPNNNTKIVTLPVSLKEVLITRPLSVFLLSDSEYGIPFTDYYINEYNKLRISATNDKSRFVGYAELYFIYK